MWRRLVILEKQVATMMEKAEVEGTREKAKVKVTPRKRVEGTRETEELP